MRTIQSEKYSALNHIRSNRIPLVLRDGVQVYECPKCKSNSVEPGFAVWHDKRTCVEVSR